MDYDAAYGDGQFEAAWTSAARIEEENTILIFNVRLMGMTVNDGFGLPRKLLGHQFLAVMNQEECRPYPDARVAAESVHVGAAGRLVQLRMFAAFSPEIKNTDAFLAYDGSYTDGPFLNPLHYLRNNITGNLTRHLGQKRQVGFKFNFDTNGFDSSGQIPLDLVAERQLDRFCYIDPDNGGNVRSGVGALYFRQELASGDVLKLDGFVSRSLFDL